MRRALLAALVLLALSAPAAAAQAPLLVAEDAADLANGLATAQEQQDVCYGWIAQINGVPTDVGSSTGGPGQPLDRAACAKGFAELQADLTYTCETCEAEDSAFVAIDSNLPDPPTTADLARLGYGADDLLGDEDDVALVQMVGALPLLAAERGSAAPVEFELPETVPATDRATSKPGNDFLRTAWPMLVLCAFLVAAGPLWWLYKRANP